jgi:hypothetical protein
MEGDGDLVRESERVQTRSVGNTLGWKFSVDIADPAKEKGRFVVLVNLHANRLPDCPLSLTGEGARDRAG